jgi:nitroreductase/NAD-dependent dihydropyrimidine dehydrogenase PreA subunit
MKIQRDEDKCNQCMLCVKDCVAGVWREENGKPVMTDPDSCNLCSHCLAVCPKGAITHDALDPEQVRRVQKRRLNSDTYREIVLSRRSVRNFRDDPVPRETIEQIIDMARYSPTASNKQNVGYIVVTDKELIRKTSKRIFGLGKRIYRGTRSTGGRIVTGGLRNISLMKGLNRYIDQMDYYIKETKSGRDYILHNAPVLMLLHAPVRAYFSKDDCVIAATNITNYAHAMGLGTCHIGFLTLSLRFSKKLNKGFEVPDGRRVFASLVMGHPAYTHSFTVSRKGVGAAWIE